MCDGLLHQRNRVFQQNVVLSNVSLLRRSGGLVWSAVRESYAGNRIATDRAPQTKQFESNDLEKNGCPDPLGWALGVRTTTLAN